jgi:hypothetical protein
MVATGIGDDDNHDDALIQVAIEKAATPDSCPSGPESTL